MWLIVQRECTFSDTMIYNVEYYRQFNDKDNNTLR